MRSIYKMILELKVGLLTAGTSDIEGLVDIGESKVSVSDDWYNKGSAPSWKSRVSL